MINQCEIECFLSWCSGMWLMLVQPDHFFLWITCIIRSAINGQMTMNTNQVGDISAIGHHLGYFSSKILDLCIDDLVLKFSILISILIFTFFFNCWFRNSAKERSNKLIREWIWCMSLRIDSTIFNTWLIAGTVSTERLAITVLVLPLSAS